MTLVPAPVETTTAVVLLHGLISSPEEVVVMQAVLKRHHYAVFALTIPGYSYQPQGPKTSDVSFEKWLAHLQKQVEDIKSQHDKVVMVGISAGANLALAMGLVAGHCVYALVLMSQTLFLDGWKIPWYAKLLPILLYTPLGYFYTYRDRWSPPCPMHPLLSWLCCSKHKVLLSALHVPAPPLQWPLAKRCGRYSRGAWI